MKIGASFLLRSVEKGLLNFYLGSLQTTNRNFNSDVYEVNNVVTSTKPNIRHDKSEKDTKRDYTNLLTTKRPKTFSPNNKNKNGRKVEPEVKDKSTKNNPNKPKLTEEVISKIMKKREQLGIKSDISDKWCLKCKRNNHFPSQCRAYPGPVGDTLCYQYIDNRRTPCGWHEPTNCKNKVQPQKSQKAIWGPKPGNQNKSN